MVFNSTLLANKFVHENKLIKQLFNVEMLKDDFILLFAFDEVGRGCLAGPVMSGCACFLYTLNEKLNLYQNFLNKSTAHLWLSQVNDSKKISSKKREICYSAISTSFPYLAEHNIIKLIKLNLNSDIHFEHLVNSQNKTIMYDENNDNIPYNAYPLCLGVDVGVASVAEIENLNIWNAIQLAMSRAFNQLLTREIVGIENFFIKDILMQCHNHVSIIDGHLAIKVDKKIITTQLVTAISGDALFSCIGTASIVAKVIRDKYMQILSEHFPNYLLNKHKGYATAEHRKAIKQYGIAAIHRKSFCKNIIW